MKKDTKRIDSYESGLLFPKPQRNKKKKIHKRSLIHQKDGTCYLCIKEYHNYGRHRMVHEHHIYGGANRSISEANGFKAYLCPCHHQFSKQAVHNDHRLMRMMQEDCQRVFEESHSREEFMALIGRNYL